MNYDEIQKELKQIEERLSSDEDISEEDMKSLEERVEQLEEEKKSLVSKAEKRRETLEKIKRGAIGDKKEEYKEGEKEMSEERKILENAEYRTAFLKKLQGKKLTDAEERTMTSAANSVGTAIPTVTQNLIMEKLEQYAPLLNEIELLRVDGNVTFAVETDQTDGNIHTEGATITEDGEVLIPVSLTSYEITKYITISKTVAKMSIDAFEKWLTNMLARRIARKIIKLIISGTGTNQPTGVEKANTWGATNSVTVGKTANLTEANVTDLIALLPGAYDANAKWLMSKKTLYSDFRPLQDKSKNDILKHI